MSSLICQCSATHGLIQPHLETPPYGHGPLVPTDERLHGGSHQEFSRGCDAVKRFLKGTQEYIFFFSWAVVRLVSQNIIVISYSIIPQTTQGSETNTASTCFLSAIFWLHSHKGKNNDMSQRFRESLQRQRFKNRPAGSRCLRNT